MRSPLTRFFYLVLFLVVYSFSNAQAESVTVYGLRIPVEKLEHADDHSVVVQVSGESSRLIESAELEDYVIAEMLKPGKSTNLSPQELEGFILKSIEEKNILRASHGIAVFCQASQTADQKQAKAQQYFSSMLNSQQFYEQLMNLIPRGEILDEACAGPLFFNAASYSIKIESTHLADLYRFSSSIKSTFHEEIMSELDEGQIGDADIIISRMASLYGNEDSDVSSAISAMRSYKDASRLLDEGRFGELEKVSQDLSQAGFGKAWGKFIESNAQNAVDAGVPEKALSLLSLSKGESTFADALLIASFKSLKPEGISVLTNQRVREFVARSVSSNPKLQHDIIPLFDSLLNGALSSNQVLGVPEAMQLLSSWGSSAGDTYVFRAALAQANAGREDIAGALFGLLGRPLTFAERLRFFMLTRGWLISLIAGALSLSLLCSVVWRLRSQRTAPAKRQQEEEGETERPRFVTSATWGRVSVGDPEYVDLLSFFNLGVSATEKEIKNAFRKKIKEVHPDVSTKASDEKIFIQTKENYERLLALIEARKARRS